MSLTLTDLEDRVFAQLRDEDREFTTTEHVRAWLNDAAADIAARTKVIRREVTQDTLQDPSGAPTLPRSITSGSLQVPDDFIEVVTLRLGDDDVELVADDVFHDVTDTQLGLEHTIGRYFGGYLELLQAPDDGADYTLRYVALPALMDTDDDVSELPSYWHMRLTYYALAQAWMQKDDGASSDRWLARYEQGLPSPDTGRQVFNSGPVSMTFEGGPFDHDADAIHI